MRSTMFAAAILLSASAFAAQEGWTPAPVPNVAPGLSVMPAERAAPATGPERDAPFSSIPTGSTSAGGATSSNHSDDVGTPSVSK